MSRSRATRPLMRYSLCPLRYKRRLTTTSPGFVTVGGFSAFLFFLPKEPESAGAGVSACPSAGGRSVGSDGAGGSKGSASAGGVAGSSRFPGPVSLASVAGEPSMTKRAASASSGSSMVRVTSARPMGGRLVVPLKIQSAMRSARRDLWLCSPRTQLIASTTLDLPQPLGPTMQVVPMPLKVTTVRSQKDLKPTISTFRSLSKLSPLVVSSYFATARSCVHPRADKHKHTDAVFRAKRDDVSFLEGGSLGRHFPSVTDRK